jgi:phospholipase D-like protein
MSSDYQVFGDNNAALFTMKIHRGEGMALLAMNWKQGKPPEDFVGFAIEYIEPVGNQLHAIPNRINFPGANGEVNPAQLSTRQSPIQKFRWVHFPMNADLPGDFTYTVTPVFMDAADRLTYGQAQTAKIQLRAETYPGKLNIAFTRGFISSQAFVDHYGKNAVSTLLPAKADGGLKFTPTNSKAGQAYEWMGFESRREILKLLDDANADGAEVRVVAYDFNVPEILTRLEALKGKLKIIIDDSGSHQPADSAESQSETRLVTSAGRQNVKREHMGNLQHNKFIVVEGPNVKAAVCGSTNFSWRGIFVQNNNAVIIRGPAIVALMKQAFDDYWNHTSVASFGATSSAGWNDLGVSGVNAQISMSPHTAKNARLKAIADDIGANTTSSLLFSLAFLYQTPGPILDAIKKLADNKQTFMYGISDHTVGGLEVARPDGIVSFVQPSALTGDLPEPFKSEPTGGSGTRMHHKFVVIDFDKPTARVYTGSYNFSSAADTQNGENLLLIRDPKVATSYMVEALRIFDHYHFRVLQQESANGNKKLLLAKPPRNPGEKPWWDGAYTDPMKIQDRLIFA